MRPNYFEVVEKVLADSLGDRQAATDATYALAQAGLMRLLYASHEAMERLSVGVVILAQRTWQTPGWTNAFGDPLATDQQSEEQA